MPRESGSMRLAMHGGRLREWVRALTDLWAMGLEPRKYRLASLAVGTGIRRANGVGGDGRLQSDHFTAIGRGELSFIQVSTTVDYPTVNRTALGRFLPVWFQTHKMRKPTLGRTKNDGNGRQHSRRLQCLTRWPKRPFIHMAICPFWPIAATLLSRKTGQSP
jgi:hypothetical protein